MRIFVTIAAAALLAGCATTQKSAATDLEASGPRDPLEGFNRAVWGFNQTLDKVAMKPVSTVYRTITPRAARRGILHVFDNLTEPWSFVNNLLQGKPGRAVNNLGRFVVNTTIGVGGLADHATGLGIKPAPEDFGQTLAAWGVKSSTYIVLPLFGPSTIRDGIGTGVGMFADPVNICLRECTDLSWTERMIPDVVNLVSIRANLTETGADTLLNTSLDPYATARSAYFQRRAAEIADQAGDAGSASDADVDAAIKELDADTPTADAPNPDSAPAGDEPAATPAPQPTEQPQEEPAAPPQPSSSDLNLK
ncbi:MULTISPECIES: MlaA family lipoprotein [Sphingomonas]|uniref:VacJ family lipoprotein n=1 Tax=Edaphosphingomonas fennica TaxID=114404 RepID=A0A2T4HYE0_9SPHN|nr:MULTISPECIES: VacJ family lipoprotein [Sphingomonas]MDX3885232.1 MlaA family lipoprotein [Sphingomonas sp.]PTD21119.1 VacJ family lipoprotein [Sphingomonas fennica]